MKDKLTLYVVVSFVSLLVRNFFLPNPFEICGEKAFLYNAIAEAVVHFIAFAITGVFYEKGSKPVIGSILYLVFYAAIMFGLWLISLAMFAWWSIVLLIIAAITISLLIAAACYSGEGYD